MKKILAPIMLAAVVAAGAAAQSPEPGNGPAATGLSGGLGMAVNGILPLTGEYGLLGLALDLRAGGYLNYSPLAIGNAGLGIEAAAWVFALPLPGSFFFMAEAPVFLAARIPLAPALEIIPQLGYCAMIGVGQSAELTHCAAAGARLVFGGHFAELGAYTPVVSDGEAVTETRILPHAAFGWRL